MTTSDKTQNGMAQLEHDGDTGVVTISLKMDGRANKMNDDFGVTLLQAFEWAKAREGLEGIILTSGHKDFCVGGDLERLYEERDAANVVARIKELDTLFRSIETIGVPVVAALNGSALGGGYELALVCHHRIVIDDPRIVVGLPEVTLGLLPGAGGTQRLPRLIGIQAALENIAQGRMVRAPKAKGIGLVDALAPDRESMHKAAVEWIQQNPRAKQPWDKGPKIPGPQPRSGEARQIFMAACAMLRKKTAGAFPAPELAISAMQEGLGLTLERGLEVESRYFAKLATSDQAKDMIRTLWFHRTAADKQEGLPKVEDMGIKKVGIIGAGMMGSGLAFISAQAGFDVVLKDVKQEQLDKAEAHLAQSAKKITKHLSEDARKELLARIKPTLELEDLDGCDLVIEAVFENLELKHMVVKETEPKLAKNGFWASNTSALPITDLAKASEQPNKFIGMHFFSPVEKMQLLEIICTEQTDEDTLARTLAFTKAIKKLPIVVNDGYGFYTTRVFSAYLIEGVQLVAEGHNPVLVEWAAREAGMVVPPLQVFDEVTLSLAVHGFSQGRKYGRTLDLPAIPLVEKMATELGRTGKAAGQGFYEYEDGRRKGLWSGLRELASGEPDGTGVDLIAERLLGIQALEAARCVEEKIIRQLRDAEVGAIFGIGFAPNTGGPLAYIDRIGPKAFVARMDEFAERFGERYQPPKLLRDMAAKGETFFPPV